MSNSETCLRQLVELLEEELKELEEENLYLEKECEKLSMLNSLLYTRYENVMKTSNN